MVNSFGGFAGNPDIETFLLSIETEFLNMVVSNSVILESYQRKSRVVLDIAARQVYPRIGLRLAAAKDKDNTPLFAAVPFSQGQLASQGYDTVRMGLYENVLRLMTDETSPLAQGITNVAASLTAAILIKSIPINTDIKNIDLGENIEKAAFNDLDRIVQIYTLDKPTNIPTDILGPDLSKQSIYLALDIDKSTLPEAWFNVGKVDERIIIEQSQPDANVRPLETLSIPSDKVAFGWYFVSGTEFESIVPDPLNSNGTTPALTIYAPVEGAFFVKDGYGADDIISTLAEYINEAAMGASIPSTELGLGKTGSRDTNVIVSPNNGVLTLGYVSLTKKKLYPDSANKTYDRKLASFRMQQRVNSLTFDARRVSSIVSRELIILRFFTLDKIVLAQKKLESSTNPSFAGVEFIYKGAWSPATIYTKGEIVDIASRSYVANYDEPPNQNLNQNPLTTTGYWTPLFIEADDLVPYKAVAQDYIEGLLYGLNNSYTFLDKKGPKSVLLSVQNGNLKVINPSASGDPNELVDTKVIDTFYFKLAEDVFSVSGTLKLRVASTKLADFPEMLPFLNPIDNTLDIELSSAGAEDAALEVLKAVHLISQYTDVLSALVYPHALQFTAFKRTLEEVREVIDIIQVPPGLEIATGSSIGERTPYRNRARSLIVDAVPIPTALRNKVTLPSDVANNPALSSAQFKGNSLVQSVRDKLNFLNNRR